MMRSGTTLVEQILSNHPEVAAGGELKFWLRHYGDAVDLRNETFDLPRCAEILAAYLDELSDIGPLCRLVTDKLPDNYRHLGLLNMLFPNARIIHCSRNPIDTCLSIYSQPFQQAPAYAHDKDDLAFAYREYMRFMDHWVATIPQDRIMTVSYERLVQDQEAMTRQILGFCDLEWHDACMSPESNRRPIHTSSHWQARQPVYRSSVERWRNYEPWLGALRDLEVAPHP
jgi:hypothetical protein